MTPSECTIAGLIGACPAVYSNELVDQARGPVSYGSEEGGWDSARAA